MNSIDLIKDRLLKEKGTIAHVVKGPGEIINARMAIEGQFFDPNRATSQPNLPFGGCHYNSIEYWYLNKDHLRICTGYCLLDDDVWISHTWCVDDEDNIYECTPIKRSGYFGLPLNEEETKMFIEGFAYDPKIMSIYEEVYSRKYHR